MSCGFLLSSSVLVLKLAKPRVLVQGKIRPSHRLITVLEEIKGSGYFEWVGGENLMKIVGVGGKRWGFFFFFLSSGPIVVIANATIDLGPIVTFENVVIGPLLNFFFLVMDYKLLTFFFKKKFVLD